MTSTRPRGATLFVLLFAVLSQLVVASEVRSIPAEVESVVTGGAWRSSSGEGVFRVVVLTGGSEHLVSQVQVDWIAESTGKEERRVVASRVAQTGSWRILRSRLVRRGGNWYASLDAIETHFTPSISGTWEVKLGAPGELNAVLKRK